MICAFRRRALIAILWLLVALASASAARHPEIPAWATFAGVRVGFDTIETLEARIGHGRVTVGGHPRGGREWQCSVRGWDLDADGFYYRDSGTRVLDTLTVTQVTPDGAGVDLPVAHVSRPQLRFMGVVSLGMSRSEVRRLTGPFSRPAQVSRAKMVFQAHGLSAFNSLNHYRLTAWTAELRFRHGRVSSIRISVS